jgi:hypothetical protein
MTDSASLRSQLLDAIVAYLDIPKSYYEKAAARHRSLYEWLVRDDSTVAAFDPDVRPQGSFRYGTVIRPIFEDDEYDLDNVCLLRVLDKSKLTQEQLKVMYGEEIKAYARAHSMLTPVSERNRCWRLHYADEARFHLDTLPCIPAEQSLVESILQRGVERDLARRAVAITDRKHPHYREICLDWLSSNPRGFAAWFESRAALGRTWTLGESRLRASVEDVPPYEWKTTLQRSIQLLKRHRDVMFRKQRELAPISMIITNLAAHAYNGEQDLYGALRNILDGMLAYISPVRPRVPNPTHPAEDYADKWSRDARLEKSFYEWHAAASADLEHLVGYLGGSDLPTFVSTRYEVALSDDEIRSFGRASNVRVKAPAIVAPVSIPRASKPWGAK